MSENTRLWVRLKLGMQQGCVTIVAEAPGEPSTQDEVLSDLDADRLDEFTASVGKAAEAEKPTPLGAKTQQLAQRLFSAVFANNRGILSAQMQKQAHGRPASGKRTEQVLLQIIADDAWKGVPWEAMLAPPDSALGGSYLATSSTFDVVREVVGGPAPNDPVVCDKIRVLLIVLSDVGIAEAVKEGLGDAIKNGSVELAEIRDRADVEDYGRLHAAILREERRDAPPHIVHIIGHGATREDAAKVKQPVLLVGAAGDSTEVPVQSLADALAASFGSSLRLVVLDACRGAEPGPYGRSGPTGNAAEILARNAAVAVVAHLFRLDPSIAQQAAKTFYESLTMGNGDVAESVDDARRVLAADGAGAFSMVLYLRGQQTRLFVKPLPPPPWWKRWLVPGIAVLATVATMGVVVVKYPEIFKIGDPPKPDPRANPTTEASKHVEPMPSIIRSSDPPEKPATFDLKARLTLYVPSNALSRPKDGCLARGKTLTVTFSQPMDAGVLQQSFGGTVTGESNGECVATFKDVPGIYRERNWSASLNDARFSVKKSSGGTLRGSELNVAYCDSALRCETSMNPPTSVPRPCPCP